MSEDYEERHTTLAVTVLDAERAEGAAMTIGGYAAVFNNLSSDLGGFREQLSPGAFDAVLDNDVRAVFNHQQDNILGRSSAGTLRLSVDGTGLQYEVDLPNNTLGRDLYESVKRGDIKESSFRFGIAPDGEKWSENNDGQLIRTITNVSRLIDVAPVTYPAYPDATIAARSMEQWQKGADMTDVHKKRCELLKIDISSQAQGKV